MKKLLIRLLIRILNQFGLDLVFYTGYKKCTRRPRIDYRFSVQFCQFCTPTYKLAKFLLPFLTPLTENEYTVKDSFHFGKQICKQDPDLCMTSLYVDSLYTHIPPNKTVDICIDSL